MERELIPIATSTQHHIIKQAQRNRSKPATPGDDADEGDKVNVGKMTGEG
jgi:hypothetical protein